MSEEVRVRRLGHAEWAAEVVMGYDTSSHRVVWSDELVEDLELPSTAEGRIAVESVRYLLDREVATSLPHDIVLDDLSRADQGFLPELRQRLMA
jgi:hypothetical protein